jgi:anthranilate synthase component 1
MPAGILVQELAIPAELLRILPARSPHDFPLLFDSATHGPLGRWSLLAAYPSGQLLQWGDGTRRALGDAPAAVAGEDFLAAFERWWQRESPLPIEAGLPFTGGWCFYLGYEIAAEIEPGLGLPAAAPQALLAAALRVPAALLHDHQTQRSYAVAEAGQEQRLQRLVAAVTAAAHSVPDIGTPWKIAPREEDAQRFRDAVLRAQRHILAGDIYQANLSRSWSAPLGAVTEPAALYERLRAANPAPFAAWARLPELELMSSSPERLLHIDGRRVETRPIAGTRARSRDPRREAVELRELLASVKERAEHVMLIDLERNDLGRVCTPGSVHVDEWMISESYEHVHHIVSNVCGELRAGVSPVAALRAVFPGGTITGCPKYRCMQLIGELEGVPRGAYTGSLGYLGRDGRMDSNILIRTLTLAGGELGFRTGAGIVADSDWERELAETRAKALGLLRALGSTAS